jgi:rhamnosyl/mannosyltransferase
VQQASETISLSSAAFSLRAFTKFKQLSREADIIHYHFPDPMADLLHFACQIKKPTIATYHSDIIRQKAMLKLYQPLMHKFLGSVDRIVATSPNYLASSPVLQQYQDKTSIIPIGSDLAISHQNKPDVMDQWQKQFPKPFFLFIGALRYYKGLHIAIEAVRETNIPLVIVGSGQEERALKQQAKNLTNIHFLGLISEDDKAALLQLCHGFVFPSHVRSEAFGIALLEAASYEKPLISCEIGTGTSYINIDRQTGLVVAPNSASELRQAMELLLSTPDKTKQYGKNAKNRALTLFTAEKQAKAYHELYNELLNS